jgi:hypothetical protein
MAYYDGIRPPIPLPGRVAGFLLRALLLMRTKMFRPQVVQTIAGKHFAADAAIVSFSRNPLIPGLEPAEFAAKAECAVDVPPVHERRNGRPGAGERHVFGSNPDVVALTVVHITDPYPVRWFCRRFLAGVDVTLAPMFQSPSKMSWMSLKISSRAGRSWGGPVSGWMAFSIAFRPPAKLRIAPAWARSPAVSASNCRPLA